MTEMWPVVIFYTLAFFTIYGTIAFVGDFIDWIKS